MGLWPRTAVTHPGVALAGSAPSGPTYGCGPWLLRCRTAQIETAGIKVGVGSDCYPEMLFMFSYSWLEKHQPLKLFTVGGRLKTAVVSVLATTSRDLGEAGAVGGIVEDSNWTQWNRAQQLRACGLHCSTVEKLCPLAGSASSCWQWASKLPCSICGS